MKIAALVIMGILIGAASASACTDPSPKKAMKSADETSIVYEYFRPAKVQDKKSRRTIAQIADSILTSARAKYEADAAENTNGSTTSSSARMTAETRSTPQAFRERAEIELYKIKSWADSICNSFRRGYYKIGPEDAPR